MRHSTAMEARRVLLTDADRRSLNVPGVLSLQQCTQELTHHCSEGETMPIGVYAADLCYGSQAGVVDRC